MVVLKNITREHLLQAIDKIDKENVPAGANSKFYDVVYKGKTYPPKLVVAYANLFANNEELDRNKFKGGLGTPCFELLESNGFTIVPKEDVFPIINDFLLRVYNDPNNLTTSDFDGEFKGLEVVAGFGKGNAATIPWIAFLGENQKVSDGIYPVYLYYKDEQLLVLAYGISETKAAALSWGEKNETVGEFFAKENRGKPKRYGGSYFFRSYEVDVDKDSFGLNKAKLNKDIAEIFAEYKKTLEASINNRLSMPEKKALPNAPFDYQQLLTNLSQAGLFYNPQLVLRFVSALAAKPFVILTGLSGSGKTKLAISFAEWITANKNQIKVVPVGADWTNREFLLGFPNMQREGEYVYPDNGALKLIIDAIHNPELPYFLILDEMNLSHVERYFADFLSCMESKQNIDLHPGTDQWKKCSVPNSICLPANLFIVGTVNIDETTYMFSPKVLDRSSVIEFRVSTSEMSSFLEQVDFSNRDELKSLGAHMAQDFLRLAVSKQAMRSEAVAGVLMSLFKILKEVGAEFGYRTAGEIFAFAAVAPEIAKWTENNLIDAIIMQKLLPKLHGSRRKLEPVIKSLAAVCLEKGLEVEKWLTDVNAQSGFYEAPEVKYPLSLEKLQRMYLGLLNHNFTSYAEA